MAEKVIEDFKCEWCGEEYQSTMKFQVLLLDANNGNMEQGISCPDCIAAWFQEDPESIKTMTISKVEA